MSTVSRSGALEPLCEKGSYRSQDFKPPRRLLARPRHPRGTSTCLPNGSSSAHHRLHRRPIYMSFVSKAILWERGDSHYAAHDRPVHHHTVCPRFLSHMKIRPENFHTPYFLNSKSKTSGLTQGDTQRTHDVAAPKPQMFVGHLCFNPGRRQNGIKDGGLIEGSGSAVVPSLQFPPTPPPSCLNPTPPQSRTPHPDSGRQENKLMTTPTPASFHPPPLPPLQEKYKSPKRGKGLQPALVEPDLKLNFGPAGSACSPSPTSLSLGSFSGLSRPPSSLFSRSTDLSSGRSSVLSDNSAVHIMDTDPGGSRCLSPQMQLPLVSLSPVASNLHRSQENLISSTTRPPSELLSGHPEASSPHPAAGLQLNLESALSGRNTKMTENLDPDPSTDPSPSQSQPYDEEHATPTFPFTTWTSCPSPQRTTPCSVSEAKPTPSSPPTQLEVHRWPVLPPISPSRGHSVASHCSELSCSQSHMFDELEAIAPLSTSCLSLDQSSDSSRSPSPETELSPGLAALTVGCDSGNLGSLSRVQLLLLDRPVPDTLLNPSGLEEAFSPVEDWSDMIVRYDDAGDVRPRTAGSVSERCDSAGKVQGGETDWSDGGSGSPSSWIIDASPSFDMFRSSDSPCHSNYGSQSHNDEASYPESADHAQASDEERKPWSCEQGAKGKDGRMEEKKTKALSMLSKLQDDTPRQSKSSKSRSNFEDFDFLAKYCIFSQEKLAEYKRAFEAEDGDSDGYISCLQVLLALKTIIPAELLSDEEEIYVYRILEMVDFRMMDGLVDLRLFAVIASLAQKIASMDEFMRSLISNMDFRSLEVRLFKAKQLFLFLLEEQPGDAGAQQGFISGEQLLLELKAGGIHLEQEAAIRLELQHIPPLDLLDFLAYLPLFMLIHKSVISNPLGDSSHL